MTKDTRMISVVALLRGINVGGHNLIKMSELTDICQTLGLQNIRTYIQSGNIVFQTKRIPLDSLSKTISKAILELKGFEPDVLLLSEANFYDAIHSNPFKESIGHPKCGHLFFFSSTPKNLDLELVETMKSSLEEFHLGKNVIYMYTPDGIGRSKLVANMDKLLGVPTTARNWRTILKIRDLLEEIKHD